MSNPSMAVGYCWLKHPLFEIAPGQREAGNHEPVMYQLKMPTRQPQCKLVFNHFLDTLRLDFADIALPTKSDSFPVIKHE